MTRQHTSWPFREAERIIRATGADAAERSVIFETGFGPSGLPHIGTFAEVARTTWVRRAFEYLTGRTTRLIAFSDDLDGLRKVPDNLPNPKMLAEHLGRPLADVPDPYGCCGSFSGHMIAKLQEFLEAFGFDVELRTASQTYRAGEFNHGLRLMLENVEKILEIMLPTLKAQNRVGWSPFLPRCERCSKVYTTRVTAYRKEELALDYVCDAPFGDVRGCGHAGSVSVLDGSSKVGWKMDWALRWACLGVDYEMYGKDLIPSAELSAKIVRLLGGRPPCGFSYEMFLDENGEKISKSRGNGVSVEQWLRYAPVESLAHFIFRDPRQAKKLHVHMIPRTVDEYLEQLRCYPGIVEEKRPDAAVWHIHATGASVPAYDSSVSFTLVNNLISALGQADASILKSYLARYDDRVRTCDEVVDHLVAKALVFYEDHVLPHKRYRKPTPDELPLFVALAERLRFPGTEDLDEKELQSLVFDIAREHGAEARDFFSAVYEVLLGQERGPRFGSFAKLVGVDRVAELIRERVGGDT